ncbi:UDP-N-acetylmuramoyl-L-alanyl-D-glutamate--2,6-diaminopimelate ligase [Gilvimarinus sp. 1_MG-2023]|uniref:UDP-N-acetylmuramoyl-L-alanyl-D-glutamate--2, 6-diaminopimelate ligase n=1 Tax=Gilvimarinus sp. 1_MG-2023 TaxID=3062638 RepID=UPI0026E323D4|nr:UDP-N-acetylmuramoyl-L-alanyl-D-glutamate--2,6-diaminopimelate ligase [Gilvimarinus sp. 1_MG-2023]MDO6746916.1 UDP-N-acetylmuramoyl-L-alanyl-D-glutamate--2,6-diaminopimelate ligase [Gilvimarinus sp. 1_MG-2023]
MRATTMKIESLLEESLSSLAKQTFTGITLDSRNVLPGDLFIALQGARINAVDYIDDAIEAGAVAVLADKRGFDDHYNARSVVWIDQLDKKLSHIAGIVFGDPSASMDVIGITGTNGKTTTALLIAQLMSLVGKNAASLGTLGYGKPQREITATGLTTPDAITVQRALQELAADGVDALAMEVSSHALVQHRVKDIRITTAIFTNLSHDHLDYHGDFKQYGKAKAKLLKSRGLKHAILNLDDVWCAGLQKRAAKYAECFTYSIHNPKADLYCHSLQYSCSGVSGRIEFRGESASFNSPLIGEFNASNLLAAISAILIRGYDLKRVVQYVPLLKSAPGRMEQVQLGPEQGVQVVVDYAHTPDALIKALRALRLHADGSVWCVFGCGGDRDVEKRSIMGRAAEKSSDYIIVTNDNPRSEDPAAIAAQIVEGMHNPERCLVIPDRGKAIELAVQQAAAGDAVLIAGKGHEQVQIFADKESRFNDVECAISALQKRGGA